MRKQLTPKQARFAAEYALDPNSNGTRAAIIAGVPEVSAAVTACRWLKNRAVIATIEDAQERAAQRYEVNAAKTLRRLAEIAYGDLRDLVDDDGNMLPMQRMSEAARTLIAGLEVETIDGAGRVKTVTHKVKLADRIRALDLLGKYLKLWTDKVEHSGRLTLEQLLTESWNDEGVSANPG